MPPARVPSQQLNSLSGSPTTGTTNTNTTTTTSVRRNLFSAHLSRRPASGSQSSSQGSSTQPHFQSNQHPHAPPTGNGVTAPDQEPSYHRLPRPTPVTNGPAPGHAPPPTVSQIQAASRRYQHQRSVSTPSLSPSPPRLSPFHNLPPAAAFGHNVVDITAGGPPFAPTPPRHMTAATDTYDYDPTISPNRPLSPRSRETLFPNSSIIALNPVTGRPILPHLPVLPGRLRLTDDDGGADHEDEGDEDPDGTPDAVIHHHHHHHRHQPSDPDMIHTHSSTAVMMMHAAAEDEASLEADEERRDRERIERMLREMMARQRARAKLSTTHKPSSANMVGDGPPSASSAANVSSSGVKKRSTRQHYGRSQRHRHISPMENGDGDEHHDGEDDLYAAEDADSEESEAEREELMGLITASLRREVARAEDEGWMYGDSGMGVGIGWDGREEGLVGGYE